MKLNFLLDEVEKQSIRYVCITTDQHRYDFAIVYTQQFLGNTIILAIQTGKMSLMAAEDIENPAYWQEQLGVAEEDIHEIQQFFHTVLGKYEYVMTSY